MDKINPHDLKGFVQLTTLDYVMRQDELQLAKRLHEGIRDAWSYCAERPRWQSWWDQMNRASMSVVLNCSQGYGKGRGYLTSDLMIARGEAFEVAAGLAIGPKEVTDPLKPTARDLIAALSHRLAQIEDKPDYK